MVLRNVALTVLKHNHHNADPANTPQTINATTGHSGLLCEPEIGPKAAKIPMNERIVIGFDRVRKNVVRKSRGTVDRGAGR